MVRFGSVDVLKPKKMILAIPIGIKIVGYDI